MIGVKEDHINVPEPTLTSWISSWQREHMAEISLMKNQEICLLLVQQMNREFDHSELNNYIPNMSLC
jgi:hypothetical protein